MRGISIKAFVVGNVLNPVLIFAVTLVMMMTIAAVQRAPGESYAAAMQALSHAQGFLFAVAAAALIVVIFVGYVAASLSSLALPLNAALSTAVLILWNLALLLRPSTEPGNWLVNGLTWAVPLFAALGGYARARQVAQGSGPIRWRLGMRFALAIFVALLAEMIIFALLARVAPTAAFSSAIAGSLVAAYAIAPPENRNLAAWMMLGIAGLVVVAIFVDAAVTGTLKFFDYFLLLSVIAAAIIGRTMLRPARTAGFSAPIAPNRPKPDKVTIQPAPRMDTATERLWMRPEQQRDSGKKDG